MSNDFFSRMGITPAGETPATGDFFSRMGIQPATRIPPAWAKRTYQPMAEEAARKHGIPEDLFARLIEHESGWNTRARSPKGAVGLGQLMPATAKALGIGDPYNAQQNLEGAAQYLSQQYKAFGDWSLALAAYNAGPGAVWKYRGLPPYKETQAYVRAIYGEPGTREEQRRRVLASEVREQNRPLTGIEKFQEYAGRPAGAVLSGLTAGIPAAAEWAGRLSGRVTESLMGAPPKEVTAAAARGEGLWGELKGLLPRTNYVAEHIWPTVQRFFVPPLETGPHPRSMEEMEAWTNIFIPQAAANIGLALLPGARLPLRRGVPGIEGGSQRIEGIYQPPGGLQPIVEAGEAAPGAGEYGYSVVRKALPGQRRLPPPPPPMLAAPEPPALVSSAMRRAAETIRRPVPRPLTRAPGPTPAEITTRNKALAGQESAPLPEPEPGATSEARFSLSPAETDAVRAYTGHIGYELNRRLRLGLSLGSYEPTVASLDSALEKMPQTPGLSYRGVQFSGPLAQDHFDAFLAGMPEGATIAPTEYLSTQNWRGIKWGDPVRGQKDVYIEIHGNHGVNISPLSVKPSEGEIVFPRRSRFFVESVRSDGTAARVVLREAPSPPLEHGAEVAEMPASVPQPIETPSTSVSPGDISGLTKQVATLTESRAAIQREITEALDGSTRVKQKLTGSWEWIGEGREQKRVFMKGQAQLTPAERARLKRDSYATPQTVINHPEMKAANARLEELNTRNAEIEHQLSKAEESLLKIRPLTTEERGFIPDMIEAAKRDIAEGAQPVVTYKTVPEVFVARGVLGQGYTSNRAAIWPQERMSRDYQINVPALIDLARHEGIPVDLTTALPPAKEWIEWSLRQPLVRSEYTPPVPGKSGQITVGAVRSGFTSAQRQAALAQIDATEKAGITGEGPLVIDIPGGPRLEVNRTKQAFDYIRRMLSGKANPKTTWNDEAGRVLAPRFADIFAGVPAQIWGSVQARLHYLPKALRLPKVADLTDEIIARQHSAALSSSVNTGRALTQMLPVFESLSPIDQAYFFARIEHPDWNFGPVSPALEAAIARAKAFFSEPFDKYIEAGGTTRRPLGLHWMRDPETGERFIRPGKWERVPAATLRNPDYVPHFFPSIERIPGFEQAAIKHVLATRPEIKTEAQAKDFLSDFIPIEGMHGRFHDAMVKEIRQSGQGKTLEEAERIFEWLFDRQPRKSSFGSFGYARVYNMPYYAGDIRLLPIIGQDAMRLAVRWALEQYGRRSWRHVAQTQIFGDDDLWLKQTMSQIRKEMAVIPDETERRGRIKEIAQLIETQRELGAMHQQASGGLLRLLDDFQVLKLAFSQVANLTQATLNSLVLSGGDPLPVMKGLLSLATKSGRQAAIASARRVGSLPPTGPGGMNLGEGVPDSLAELFYKVTGFQASEQLQRMEAQPISIHMLNKWLGQMFDARDRNAGAERVIRKVAGRLGESIISRVAAHKAKGGTLNDFKLPEGMQAAWRKAYDDTVNFSYPSAHMPMPARRQVLTGGMAKVDQVLPLVYRFKAWAWEEGRLINRFVLDEVRHGNPAPLATMLIAFLIAGEGISALKRVIQSAFYYGGATLRDQRNPPPGFLDYVFRTDPDSLKKGWVGRVAQDYMAVSPVDFVLRWGLARTPDEAWKVAADWASGPATGTAEAVSATIWNLLHGNLRQALRSALGITPPLTPAAAAMGPERPVSSGSRGLGPPMGTPATRRFGNPAY